VLVTELIDKVFTLGAPATAGCSKNKHELGVVTQLIFGNWQISPSMIPDSLNIFGAINFDNYFPLFVEFYDLL